MSDRIVVRQGQPPTQIYERVERPLPPSPSLPPTFAQGVPEFAQRPPSDAAYHTLLAEEERALRRASPRLAIWSRLKEFEGHLRRIDERRTEFLARIQTLWDDIQRAEEVDSQALADVILDDSRPRPEPTAPKFREEQERIRRELDALTRAEDKVLAAKAQWVASNRKSLVKDADKETARHQERIVALVGDLEQERIALVEARLTTIWAACFGTADAMQGLPTDSLFAGLAEPSRQTLGTDVQLAAEKLYAALRLDAEVLRTVATPAQQKAFGKKVPNRDASWQNGEVDSIGPNFEATWAGTPEEAQQANRVKAYTEAMRRRLWPESE